MDHRHIASLNLEASRRLKSQKAASNDDRLFPRSCVIEQGARIVEIAESNTPFLSTPSIGGISGELPVARSSLSKVVTLPSSPVTVFRSRSDIDDADA